MRGTAGDKNVYEQMGGFAEHAKIGQTWADHVAQDLNQHGIDCKATPLELAKDIADRARFENEQDITFSSHSGCLEVKSRNLRFTDDPQSFPYATAFVDTVSGWEKKSPFPLAVVLVSQITEAKLVVPVSTYEKWGKQHSFDRIRNYSDVWYTVNKSYLRSYSDLKAWLTARVSMRGSRRV